LINALVTLQTVLRGGRQRSAHRLSRLRESGSLRCSSKYCSGY